MRERISLCGIFDIVVRKAAAPGKLALLSLETGNWLRDEGRYYVASTMDWGIAHRLKARLEDELGLHHGDDFAMLCDTRPERRECLKWMSIDAGLAGAYLLGPRRPKVNDTF